MRYLAIFGKNRYPRFLAESRNVLDDRLSTLICQPSTSVESTGSHISSLKLDTVAGDAGPPSIVAVFRNENEFTKESCNSSFTLLFSFAVVTLKFLSNKNENHRRRESNLTRIANFLTFHDGTFVLFACRPRYRPRDRVYSAIERERAWKRDTSTTGKQKVREISIDRTSGKINLSAFDPTLISSVLVRSRLL